MTPDEVLRAYADALGRTADTLSDDEKRRAFIDAILAGKRIEPFATIADGLEQQLESSRQIASDLADWLASQQTCE